MSKLKKIINITLAGILVLTLLMSVITVINRESKENFIYRNKEPKKIGATYMTLNNPFYQIIDNEIRSVVNANGDNFFRSTAKPGKTGAAIGISY